MLCECGLSQNTSFTTVYFEIAVDHRYLNSWKAKPWIRGLLQFLFLHTYSQTLCAAPIGRN